MRPTEMTPEEEARLVRLCRGALEHAERPRWTSRCERPRPSTRARWPWWLVLAGLLFASGFFTGKVYAAERPLTLIVRPLIMINRGDIHVEARVLRQADNRLLAIAWTSETGTAGSTEYQIAGDDGPVLCTRWLPAQPPAHYLFVATLFNKLGKVAGTARAEVHVPDDGDIKP